MRPTHVSIVGRSKHIFSTEIQSRLRRVHQFDGIIAALEPGPSIRFSNAVADFDHIDGLIKYLVREGIPRNDIRVRYDTEGPEGVLSNRLADKERRKALNFGPDVAEHDPGLERYFVKTQSFAAIHSGLKHLVIGPKGSGKSAILRALSTELTQTLIITPEHYATDVLASLGKESDEREMNAYVTTWKYTLLTEIFRQVVQTNSSAPGASDLRAYLVSQGQLGTELSLFERFSAYLRRIIKIRGKIGPTEAEISMDGPQELEKLFRMDELLAMMPSLRRVLRRKNFSVLIDELDQSWDNSETANQFLVALLTAAIQLRGIDENLNIIVFLRSEIFDLMKPTITQLDKVRSDIEEIRWSPRELSNLIVSRAFDSLNLDPGDVSAEAGIDLLFPGSAGPGLRTFRYLLSRTSFRPREVIQFCNLALRVSQELGLPAVEFQAVELAEEQFSAWKMEYVVAENLYIYPSMDYVFDRLRGVSQRMEGVAMDALLTDIILKAEGDSASPNWLRQNIEPNGLLELLYQMEIIGVEKPNSKVSNGQEWDAYDFVFSRPKARPEHSTSFLIHPGLWRALDAV